MLQHRREVDPRLPQALLRPDSARTIFENVWQAIEDIATFLISLALAPAVALAEIPEEEREPTCPRRFAFALRGRVPEVGR